MKKIINWFKTNRDSIIRNVFLLPILLVVLISMSHVVSWYDLGNPISWAIYLSVAIEIFALASVAAASIDIKKGSIWFLFGLVTCIQMIGNIFFEYQDINLTDSSFLAWVELIQPAFTDWDITDHRRLLAIVQGGTLPVMSLTALHFFIKFNEKKIEKETKPVNKPQTVKPSTKTFDSQQEILKDIIEEAQTNRSIDAVAALEDILVEELAKAENEIEPIDEEALLSEELPEKEISVLGTAHDEKLSDTLDTLDEITKAEDNIPAAPKKPAPTEDKGDTFGPPQINN